MAVYVVEGGKRLTGEIDIQGSKNAALPIMAAAMLNKGITVLHNCPLIDDIYVVADIMKSIGCNVTILGHKIVIDATSINNTVIDLEEVALVRASVLLLGALIARCGNVNMNYPGGCEIGSRPIDFHLDSFAKMGIRVITDNNTIDCSCNRVNGGNIVLQFPSVGATENIILAACGAMEDTIIDNAAREPEIIELTRFLAVYGYQIYGAGTSRIHIKCNNRKPETYAEYTIISDRIVAGTYAYAAAITQGEITCKVNSMSVVDSSFDVLEMVGCNIIIGNDYFRIKSDNGIKSLPYIETEPYPGFPTDMQSQLMAVLSVSDGTSVIREKIFEKRFHVVEELRKMGADISLSGDKVVIHGKKTLKGAGVVSKDLRGGAALVIAGLKADGISYIQDPGYISRGYECITGDIIRLGGIIRYE